VTLDKLLQHIRSSKLPPFHIHKDNTLSIDEGTSGHGTTGNYWNSYKSRYGYSTQKTRKVIVKKYTNIEVDALHILLDLTILYRLDLTIL
jgi:hypothetical protein